jgi:hypothetical protein
MNSLLCSQLDLCNGMSRICRGDPRLGCLYAPWLPTASETGTKECRSPVKESSCLLSFLLMCKSLQLQQGPRVQMTYWLLVWDKCLFPPPSPFDNRLYLHTHQGLVMVELLENFLNILKLFLAVASDFTKSQIHAMTANLQGVRRKR